MLLAGAGMVLIFFGMVAKDRVGSGSYMAIAGIGVLIGLAWAFYRRGRSIIQYDLGNGMLVLRRGSKVEELPLEKVLDANLIDLKTARDYVQEHAAAASGPEKAAGNILPDEVVRYCALPILDGRSVTIMSALMGGTMNYLQKDLVLLRIRDGGAYLLSPRYCELLVSSIGKAKRRASLVNT